MTHPQQQEIERLAIQYHKVQEGEYGCNGLTCPGVKRLVAFGKSCVEAALSAGAVPQQEPQDLQDDQCQSRHHATQQRCELEAGHKYMHDSGDYRWPNLAPYRPAVPALPAPQEQDKK